MKDSMFSDDVHDLNYTMYMLTSLASRIERSNLFEADMVVLKLRFDDGTRKFFTPGEGKKFGTGGKREGRVGRP